MLQTWTAWRRFPLPAEGQMTVPAVPGVYEVRHSLTGRVIAFGHTGDTARALDELRRYGAVGRFARLFARDAPRVADLEYRICAAGSRTDARRIAGRLLGMRQTVWRRRMSMGGAVGLTG